MSQPPPPTPPTPPLDSEGCFRAHRTTVYRWALALGLRHEAALDVVQETFLRLVRASPRFPSAAAQLAWLRRVAANLAADRHRARPGPIPIQAVPEPAAGPGRPGDGEEAAGLHAAMAELSEMQRLVLLAKACDGHTFAQIATDLGIAVPTAKTHYVRALTTLRDHLGTHAPGPVHAGRPAAGASP